jgi:hypothetical protein
MRSKVEPGMVQSRSGIIFIVGGFLVAGIFGYLDAHEIHIPFALRFISLVMIVGGTFLYWRGRQYRAKAAAQRIIADSKPDVLYLRAFETDSSVLRYVRWSFLLPRLIAGIITEEEQLRDVLQPFGDLIAIGRPGEELPTPGGSSVVCVRCSVAVGGQRSDAIGCPRGYSSRSQHRPALGAETGI